MKTIFARAPFEFRYENRSVPKPAKGEVLVKIKTCGICATDFHNVKYYFKTFSPIGHEGAGEVIEVGPGVPRFKSGDKVAVSGPAKCGKCELCKKGEARLCCNGPSVWNSEQMMFSDYMTIDQRLLWSFKKIDYKTAALLEPGCVALELIKNSDLKKGEKVLIIGMGAIGLMAAQMAISIGVKVYGADISPAKASFASAEKIGLEGIIKTDEESILEVCSKKKIRRIMITAPPSTILQAVEAITFGGLITYIGLGHKGQEIISLDINKFLRKKATLKAVYAVPTLYPKEVMKMLESKIINSDLIITHTFKFNDIEKAFKTIEEKKGKSIKVMIEFC
ncbi:MAG: alcohol dehydrogenase catalytic domain-containing protein [bacterium]